MKVCAFCGRCYDDSVVECAGEGHPDLSVAKDRNPLMIAGYRLDLLLESSVRGETYRALQTECGRSCLIRILPADKANGERFLREARAAAAFFHPNVVDIYEAGELDTGEVFVVAEDPDGKELRGFLSNVGVPELLNTIEVVRQTAEALDALHGKGLVHGAIRPENIILATNADGRLLIRIQNVDLGGLVQRSIVSNKFLIDTALDSVRYFAPEQCAGDASCPQTDVYSLGVVMYEMLAGTPPFDAAKASGLIEKHRTQRPPDVRIDNFELRMLVTHALSESLQKQPQMRQSSANLFARQMRHIELEATHVSTPPPAGAVPAPPAPVRTVTPAKVIAAPPPVSRPKLSIEKQKVIRLENNVAPSPSPEPVVQPIEAVADVVPAESVEVQHVVEVRRQETSSSVHERVSRLKHRMKSWRAKVTAPRMFETPVVEPIALPDVSDVEQIKDTTVLAGAPLLQAKSDEIAPEKIAPTRIEWEQPEDDIPSVDDVLEVLAKEHTDEIPLAPAKPAEIPLIAAPVEATVTEAIVEVPAIITPAVESIRPEPEISPAAATVEVPPVKAAPKVRVKRKKIRSKKQESTPVVTEAPAAEPVVCEAPVVHEDPIEIPVVREPRVPAPAVKVEPEVVAAVPVSEAPVVREVPPAIPVVREPRKPAPAVQVEPEVVAAIPVREAPVVREVPRAIPVVREPRKPAPAVKVEPEVVAAIPTHKPAKVRADDAYARIPWVKGVLKDQPKEPARIAVVRDELEEITVVRARSKPIRIDIDRTSVTHGPRRDKMFDTTDEIKFVPTLLDDVEKRRTIDLDAIDDPIFGHYGGPVATHSSIRRRLLAAGGASALLIVAFLFAADLGRYAQTEGPDVSVAAKAEQQVTLPAIEPPTDVSAAKKVSLKTVEKEQPVAEKVEEKESKPAASKSQPERPVEPRTTAKQPATKNDSGKPKSVSGTVKLVAEKKPPVAASRTAGATRPRIVAEP